MKDIIILLVDDEDRFISTLKKILIRMKAIVYIADNGKRALDIVSKNPIDVVLLDVKMPGMDGLYVLEKIKESWPLTEVIMLTGHATVDSAMRGLKQGAFDYLVKPCEIDQVIHRVKTAFECKKIREKELLERIDT